MPPPDGRRRRRIPDFSAMRFLRLPPLLLAPLRLRFGLKALLFLVLLSSLALSAYFNLYKHYRDIYENEKAVADYLASGALADYREEPPFNCTLAVLYRRTATTYATRRESLPWWYHDRMPLDRSWFRRTRALIVPSGTPQTPPHLAKTSGAWDGVGEWRRFYRLVARLPELEYLKPGDEFTDVDLRLFQNHPKLRFLDLRRTHVSLEGWESIRRDFPKLEYLVLSAPTSWDLLFRQMERSRSHREEVLTLQTYEDAFARLAERPGLSVCIARPLPGEPETWPRREVISFPHSERKDFGAADLAKLAKVRAEEPEAVFYDFRPHGQSEYSPSGIGIRGIDSADLEASMQDLFRAPRRPSHSNP
jgi:hypothetical protein